MLGNQIHAQITSCKKKTKITQFKWRMLKDNVRNSELKQSTYAKFYTTWSLTLITFHLVWIWSIKWKKNGNVTTMIWYSSWIINMIIYHLDISGLQINSHGESEGSDQRKFIIWSDAKCGKSFTLLINHWAYCCTYFPELLFFKTIWFFSVSLHLFQKKGTWNFSVSSSMSVCGSHAHTYIYAVFCSSSTTCVSKFRQQKKQFHD